MRIVGVRFKNLNSLAGEWDVDFDHPAYTADGLFAIVGPTGAGKTTILDAICLALYGRTPRLERITKGANEIMSRQAGECFAEVVFETVQGRFRVHWSQRRSRRQAEGELQPVRHEIAEADGQGRVLETKLSQVLAHVEKVTGMDFKRFTRSMLLAQGGFAAFLRADPDDRGPILEQLTGTEIYSRISMAVHERRSEERGTLDLLQAGLAGVQPLDAGQEEELRRELGDLTSREARERSLAEGFRYAIRWREQLASLEEDLAQLDDLQGLWEEKRAGFAPRKTLLLRANLALALEPDYGVAVSLRDRQTKDRQELTDLSETLPDLEEAVVDARAALQTAGTALHEARRRREEQSETIRAVREIDTRMQDLGGRLDGMEKALRSGEQKREGYLRRMETAEKARQRNADALQEVMDHLTQHASAAALASVLPILSRGRDSLRSIEVKRSGAEKALDALVRRVDETRGRFTRAEIACSRLSQERVALEEGLEALALDAAKRLDAREWSDWREDLERCLDRERRLQQVAEALARVEKAGAVLAETDVAMATLQAAMAIRSADVATAADEVANLEREVGGLETQTALLARIRDLEEERDRLQEGQPCPLCGATVHPYAAGRVPIPGETEKALEEAKGRMNMARKRLASLERDQVKATAEAEHTIRERRERQAAREVEEASCREALELLGLPHKGDGRSVFVIKALAAIQEEKGHAAGTLAAVEASLKQEKVARANLEKTRLAQEEADVERQRARSALEIAEKEKIAMENERAGLADDEDRLLQTIRDDGAPFGMGDVVSSDLDALLVNLQARQASWEAKQREKALCEEAKQGLQADLQREQALLEVLEKDLVGRRQEWDTLAALYAEFRGQREELFGRKNPDEEEKALVRAVTDGEVRLEGAQAALAELERDVSARRQTATLLKEKITRRQEELIGFDVALTAGFTNAGFDGEADFLAARLPDRERTSLAEMAAALEREGTELAARRADKAAALAREREKNLSDIPLPSLWEALQQVEGVVRGLQERIGALKGRLAENERVRAELTKQIRAVEIQKEEWARWDDLHQLIGSADGKKFRNFAQGLTFEAVVFQANRHLREMTDRYLLVRDLSQPLELNVIDSYQAGEIRSTKNLSGGETFLVSLALALGLSQMASRKVRVDSLFLDEGFGTLDDETLETALETLGSLRRNGKLIGVISHVPALKERIAVQIQVTPVSQGRSIVSGPGCRRLA